MRFAAHGEWVRLILNVTHCECKSVFFHLRGIVRYDDDDDDDNSLQIGTFYAQIGDHKWHWPRRSFWIKLNSCATVRARSRSRLYRILWAWRKTNCETCCLSLTKTLQSICCRRRQRCRSNTNIYTIDAITFRAAWFSHFSLLLKLMLRDHCRWRALNGNIAIFASHKNNALRTTTEKRHKTMDVYCPISARVVYLKRMTQWHDVEWYRRWRSHFYWVKKKY